MRGEGRTPSGLHSEVSITPVEEDEGESLLFGLRGGRVVHPVSGSPEVTARDHYQLLAYSSSLGMKREHIRSSVSPMLTTREPGLYLTYRHT